MLSKTNLPTTTLSVLEFTLHFNYPFETVRMDYAYPFLSNIVYSYSNAPFKCCFLLFTCATTPALHIELRLQPYIVNFNHSSSHCS